MDETNLAATSARTSQVPGHNSNTVIQIAGVQPTHARFCDSNRKLGKGLLSFDMSPIISCPGSVHAICRELRPDGNADPKPICWACRKAYRQQKMKDRLAMNLQVSRSEAFVPWANRDISRRRVVKAVRLPGVGDLYNVAFVQKVRSILQANPRMRFWLNTRSWAVPKIWEELKKLKAEPNLTLWLSWDRKMAQHHGPPPDRDIPWSWLATDDDDLPPESVNIVWRNDSESSGKRKLSEKHTLGGCLVCPHEDGVTKTTCSQCGICWRDAKFRTAKIAKLLERYLPAAKE